MAADRTLAPMPGLEGARLLVTGATGFIGGHLLRKAMAAGAEVHAVSRRTQDSETPELHWHQADLGDAEAARNLVRTVAPDLLIHLASHVAGARERSLVLPTFHANLASTVYLLEAATELGCRRIVQAGSLEEPDFDQALEAPSSPYAAAKLGATAYARMFHQLYATPVVLARLFMVYGPDQKDLRKLVPYVILSLLRGEEPRLSSGTRPVDWVYVDDVAEGLLRIAAAPDIDGQRVDLGTGQAETVRGVVQRLYRELAPGSEPGFGSLGDRPHEQVRLADAAGTAAALGWRPSTSLEQGLQRTVRWYREALSQGTIRL